LGWCCLSRRRGFGCLLWGGLWLGGCFRLRCLSRLWCGGLWSSCLRLSCLFLGRLSLCLCLWLWLWSLCSLLLRP